jgi:hypothetical protein
MVGLQVMVTIQSDNRQEFLQALDMFCSQQTPDNDWAVDNIFEAVDTPNQFCYVKQCTDRRRLDDYLKTGRFRALLGAIQVLGKLKTIQIVELEELKDISDLIY